MTDNVKSIDIGKPDPRIAALEKLRRELPVVAQQMALLAKIRRISYEAHIEAGFTPDQAMALCTK